MCRLSSSSSSSRAAAAVGAGEVDSAGQLVLLNALTYKHDTHRRAHHHHHHVQLKARATVEDEEHAALALLRVLLRLVARVDALVVDVRRHRCSAAVDGACAVMRRCPGRRRLRARCRGAAARGATAAATAVSRRRARWGRCCGRRRGRTAGHGVRVVRGASDAHALRYALAVDISDRIVRALRASSEKTSV